jgi:predicted kinase
MKDVIVLRGVPGSGKSRQAALLAAESEALGRATQTFSADRFFVGGDGVYRFDREKIGAAHGQCLRFFARDVVNSIGSRTRIVDNTNTTVGEMQTYVRLAQAFGLSFELITVSCDPELAAARNVHGVPAAKVREMHKRLIDVRLPRDWPHRVITDVLDLVSP